MDDNFSFLCPFSGLNAKVNLDQKVNMYHVKLDEFPGIQYYFDVPVKYQLVTLKRDEGLRENEKLQGHANCFKKVFEVLEYENKLYPALILRENIQEKKDLVNKTKSSKEWEYLFIDFDETFHQRIDHSKKLYWLLESFASNLSTKRAYSSYRFNNLDWLRVGIVDENEFDVLLDSLNNRKLIESFGGEISILPEGWSSLDLEHRQKSSNKVFIATAFKWPRNLPYLRTDVTESIKNACSKLGYDADVVSQNHTDNITDKIMSEIRESAFVVCELTYNNRGAYYEAGFARGLGKKVFHVVHKDFCETDEKYDSDGRRIHFDLQQIMYRKWDSLSNLEEILYDWINGTIGDFKTE